ncbi:hypothetical protein HDV62DRAFT_20092 [Trichoderma sp. SZMC 28011]
MAALRLTVLGLLFVSPRKNNMLSPFLIFSSHKSSHHRAASPLNQMPGCYLLAQRPLLSPPEASQWCAACANMNMLCCIGGTMQVPAQCTANRRVDTRLRLLSWHAVSCCEPRAGSGSKPATCSHGVTLTGLLALLAMHQLVIRW